jgi:hypothetical protein
MAFTYRFRLFPPSEHLLTLLNLALPTTHPYMDKVDFYIQNFARYIQILQIEPGAG